MTTLDSGFSNIYSINSQINAIQMGAETQSVNQAANAANKAEDPQELLLSLQVSFDKMLKNFLNASNDDSSGEDESPLAALVNQMAQTVQPSQSGNAAANPSDLTSSAGINQYIANSNLAISKSLRNIANPDL